MAVLLTYNMTVLLITILVTIYLDSTAGQTPCLTSSGKTGTCISIVDCSAPFKLTSNATPAEPQILQISVCGTDIGTGTIRMCCPSDGCSTPDGAQGTCMDLHSCPRLMKILEPRPTLAAIKHVRSLICNDPNESRVCCVPETPVHEPTSVSTKETSCHLTTLPPDPKSYCCGLDTSSRPKIFGGEMTRIDEYPWLALIEYKDLNTGSIELECGGVLISGQYVLSAAHCFVLPPSTLIEPKSVRLGEHNTTNVGPDCEVLGDDYKDCTDGAVSVPIKTIVPYPDFIPGVGRQINDIALVKLTWIIKYTDFIRPICLPILDFATSSAQGANVELHAAGWGRTETRTLSDVKMKVRLPYVTTAVCYKLHRISYDMFDTKLCAGGERNEDTCKGDSGGPLMRITDGRHELVGVVNYGPTPCGKENVPAVYAKVFYYLPWIYENIRL